MAKRSNQSVPKGRRLPAPPRRLPSPANDNVAPHRRRLQRWAAFAALLAAAVAAGTYIAG